MEANPAREAALAAHFELLDADNHGSVPKQQLESVLQNQASKFLGHLDEHLTEVTLQQFVNGIVARTQDISDQDFETDWLALLAALIQWRALPTGQEDVFDKGWEMLHHFEEEVEGWKEKANKNGFMLHYKKQPGNDIPMVRARCTFTGIPIGVVARVLTLEHRAIWDQNAIVTKIGQYADGTFATRTVYKGAFNIDDRDFIDVVRVREGEGFVETMYIDGSGWVAEPKEIAPLGQKKKKPNKVIRGRTYLSCNKLTSVQGGTSIVTISHVDLRLNSTARKIAETQIVGRTRDWFKALRNACVQSMKSEGLTMSAEASNVTSSGSGIACSIPTEHEIRSVTGVKTGESPGRQRAPSSPPDFGVPAVAASAEATGESPNQVEASGQQIVVSDPFQHDEDCQVCRACVVC